MAVRVSIGEFSVMTGLSRKALRHYHELGLLEPARIDPATGYRHYDTSQVRTAQIIRRFRGLDMPVPQVRDVLAAPDVATRNAIIAAHLRRMETQLDQTREAVGALRELLDPEQPPIEVAFRSVPAMRVPAISATVRSREVSAWWQSAVDELREALAAAGVTPAGPPGGLYATELFSDEEGAATLFLPTGPSSGPVPESGRVRMTELPAAELAVTVHAGSHDDVGRTYGALGTFVAERLLGVEGPVRENYLVDDSEDARLMRTEICWPVFRTAVA